MVAGKQNWHLNLIDFNQLLKSLSLILSLLLIYAEGDACTKLCGTQSNDDRQVYTQNPRSFRVHTDTHRPQGTPPASP